MTHDNDPLTRYNHHDEPTQPLLRLVPPPEHVPARHPAAQPKSWREEFWLIGFGILIGVFFTTVTWWLM